MASGAEPQRPTEFPLSLRGGATEGLRVVITGTKPRDQPTEVLLPLRGATAGPKKSVSGACPRDKQNLHYPPPHMEGKHGPGKVAPAVRHRGRQKLHHPRTEGKLYFLPAEEAQKRAAEAGGRAAREAGNPMVPIPHGLIYICGRRKGIENGRKDQVL